MLENKWAEETEKFYSGLAHHEEAHKRLGWNDDEKQHKRFNIIRDRVARYNKKHLHSTAIMDIGCGDGAILDHLYMNSYNTYLGVDIRPSVIEEAKQKYGHKRDIAFYDNNFFNRGDYYELIAESVAWGINIVFSISTFIHKVSDDEHENFTYVLDAVKKCVNLSKDKIYIILPSKSFILKNPEKANPELYYTPESRLLGEIYDLPEVKYVKIDKIFPHEFLMEITKKK